MSSDLDKLKYPIGTHKNPTSISKSDLDGYISDIEKFPERVTREVEGLNNSQLDTIYRPGGWTIRQVVNHCADSHINSLIRFKLALTEEKPTIRPYFEDRWAQLPDSNAISITAALKILEGTHERWVVLLRSLTGDQLKRTFIHPEGNKEISVEQNIALYAWHCNHHLAHIKQANNSNKEK